jgi:acyl-CoA thioester hydrolase
LSRALPPPAAGEHEVAVRVYYEDTDAGGIVYHGNYLKFAERGRTELLRSLGHDHRALADGLGLLFAVTRCAVEFVAPARLDDLLRVRTRPLRVGGARLELEQTVHRAGQVLARLEITLAPLDRAGLRPTRLPAALRAAFAAAAAIPGS